MVSKSVVRGRFSWILTPGPFLRRANAVIRGSDSEKTSTLCALVLGSRLTAKGVSWLRRRASRNGGNSPVDLASHDIHPVQETCPAVPYASCQTVSYSSAGDRRLLSSPSPSSFWQATRGSSMTIRLTIFTRIMTKLEICSSRTQLLDVLSARSQSSL